MQSRACAVVLSWQDATASSNKVICRRGGGKADFREMLDLHKLEIWSEFGTALGGGCQHKLNAHQCQSHLYTFPFPRLSIFDCYLSIDGSADSGLPRAERKPRPAIMPAGSVPSWAMTSSSAALFGGGSKASGRAAAEASLASSNDKAPPPTPSQQQPKGETHTFSTSSSAAPAETTSRDVAEKPYKPKRKQRSITHCPPLSSVAASSRVPYAIPHVDQSSADEALFQLIAVQAKRAGYDATTASALHQVSQLTKKFLTSVFSAATHAAELSCRDQPSARDLIYALETHGQPIRELRDFHREQLQDGEAEDENKKASAKARGKAKQNASAPQRYKAKTRSSRLHNNEKGTEAEEDWAQQSSSFLPSDSDEGSELDTWSVSSDSDNEHGNRRAAVHARVAKRKHDMARAAAKKERRQAKLRQPAAGDQTRASSSSSLARDLGALTSGEQAWHRVADHIVPRHLPGMPPRHAWMQTPAFPTNAYGSSLGGADEEDGAAGKERRDPLMLVNRKLANARLVEASLRKLIQNTDGAAAVAYASATRSGGAGGRRGDESPVEKQVSAPTGASATSGSVSGGFVVPKTPASGGGCGLTLRLKNKISIPSSSLNNSPSQPSTPIASRRASNAAGFGGSASGSGVPGTPLGMGMAMGWGGEPLMSPLTPVSASAGGAMTPYPPTPGGVYGHYFGTNPNAATGAGMGGSRSRSQSIVASNAEGYGGALSGDTGAGADKLGLRVPGPVNYKNVWYSPGSTIGSGGLGGSGGGGSANAATNAKSGSTSSNHPRSVKRMRKWKV